ncbi:MAG TPA: hypothetical protein VL346_07335 [Acidobacteriaceae bacterium]|nr:hypothetical protein [Acidobacteriaceae bacterium]
MAQITAPWMGEALCDLRVEVRTGDSSPAQHPHFRAMHHLVLVRFGAANILVMDLDRRVMTAIVSEKIAGDAAFWQAILLPILAGIAGSSIGILPAHSACLARDGQGLLLAGNSGAGKSTLSVAVAQRGYDYIADDWTYCSLRGKNLIACGMAAKTKLLADAVRHFPELAGCTVARSMNGEIAYEVPPQATFGVNVQISCEPRMLIFLQRIENGPPRFRPLDEAHVRSYFRANLERIPAQMEQASRNRVELLRAVAKLPCWRFEYSGPPEIGAEHLEDFFEEHRLQWA